MLSGDMMTDARDGGTTSDWLDQRIEAAVQRTLDELEELDKGAERFAQERHTVAPVSALPASAPGR
jgi:hypothetical protein